MTGSLSFPVYSQLCSAESARRTVGELSGLPVSGISGKRLEMVWGLHWLQKELYLAEG